MADLTIWINCDTVDSPVGTSGVNWFEFISGSDQLIFTGGSAQVIDGADTPSASELISAGIILTGSEIVVSEYLMLDAGSNLLRDIHLMGNQNTRYILGFEFSASTASEPVLEVYDDDSLDSVDSTILGSGTPSQSFIRGITTTSGLPGTNWVGSRLAGSGSGNYLELNDGNGALTAADTLYCNIKVVISASQTEGFSSNPIFVCKWLDN